MKYVIVIISFILEFIIINFISNLNYFHPSFVLVSLVINLFFYKKDSNYDFFFLVVSILYGVLFLNNVFLGIFLLYTSLIVIKKVSSLLNNSLKSLFINILFIIVFYNCLLFLILFLFQYSFFNLIILFRVIISGFIINFIYGYFLYLFIKYRSKIL